MSTAIGPGTSVPLGATVRPHGMNFSVFSKSSTAVDLVQLRALVVLWTSLHAEASGGLRRPV